MADRRRDNLRLTLMAYRYIKNRSEYPNVTLQSSLNFAKLSITAPKKSTPPPKVALIFCIDTSASMDGSREGQVKAGIKSVLDNAVKVVNAMEESQIQIGMEGFSDETHTICEATDITSETMQTIQNKLNTYRSNGSTDIIMGFEKATKTVETSAQNTPDLTQYLILLSDGEESLSADQVKPVHERLAKVGAKLFAIGIGESHKKETLRLIASSKRLKGKYIDTTTGQDTLSRTIVEIYNGAIGVFSNLSLGSSSLPEGSWSVRDTAGTTLGDVSEGETIVKTIEIDPDKLTSTLDLAHVSFKLTFSDPSGKPEALTLNWTPNSSIDRDILPKQKES